MPLHRHHPPPRPSQSPSLPPYPLTNIIEMDLPLFSSLSIYVAYNKLRLRDLLILKNSKKKKKHRKNYGRKLKYPNFYSSKDITISLKFKTKKT
jgi:hypothetical protein